MFITFLETRRISEDGFVVTRHLKGETYDIADNAARDAIQKGWAREATPAEVDALAPVSASQVLGELFEGFNRIFGSRPFPTNPATPAVSAKLED